MLYCLEMSGQSIYTIAQRINNFDSQIFQEVFRLKQSLKNPIDLSIGFPAGGTPQYIKDAGIRAIEENHTTYTPANGIPELRAAIAQKLRSENNIKVDTSQVSVVPGLTTGLLIVYLALLDRGDEVIIMDPSYPPYIHLVELAEGIVKQVPTASDFQLDLEAIEAAITSKTRAIVINSPNNPTGAVYSKASLLHLAKIAEKHDITIISDEMYEDFLYSGEHFSIGSVYPNTITMNGFSKSYSMTGWRMGYVAGPISYIQAINELLQYVVFSSSSISQYAALAALSRPAPTKETYKEKRNVILESLKSAGYTVHGSDGAYYTYFEVPKGMTDMEFVKRAIRHNLILLPGRAFSKKQTFVRLSYGGSMEDIKKGLKIIANITNQA
jgi:aspartate aminotransferase